MPADFLEGGEPPKAAKGLALALALAPLDEDDEDVDSVMRVRGPRPAPALLGRSAFENGVRLARLLCWTRTTRMWTASCACAGPALPRPCSAAAPVTTRAWLVRLVSLRQGLPPASAPRWLTIDLVPASSAHDRLSDRPSGPSGPGPAACPHSLLGTGCAAPQPLGHAELGRRLVRRRSAA